MPTWKPPTAPTAPVRQAIADWLRTYLDDSVVSDQRAPARVKRAIMKVPATAVNKVLPMAGWTETPQDLSMTDIPMPGATVLYHGSPFSFERFLKGKIGKGTGHQSEGYGHYFTDLEDEAKSYVEDLVDYSMGWPPKRTPGNLYKVEVPDDLVGKMLNYDEPLANQPAVFDKLRGLSSAATQDITGRQFYEQLRKQLLEQALRIRQLAPEKLDELRSLIRRNMEYDEEQFPKALLKRSFKDATSQLEQVGIPGNKYLGYNPRGGTLPQNVVVFPSNERAIKILERTPVIRPR